MLSYSEGVPQWAYHLVNQQQCLPCPLLSATTQERAGLSIKIDISPCYLEDESLLFVIISVEDLLGPLTAAMRTKCSVSQKCALIPPVDNFMKSFS